MGQRHPLLAEFRRTFKSADAAARGSAVLMPAEGPRLIGEAIRSGLRVEKVLFSNTGLERLGAKLMPQFSKNTVVAVADDAAFATCMDVEHPQGVAALVRLALAELDALAAPPPALVVAAAGLQDPGNLGTLIRAAEAFGATGVATLEQTVSPLNPKAVRASAGSLFRVPVAIRVGTSELVAFCKQHGLALVASAASAGREVPDTDLSGPTCLVIGQESGGVPRELQRAANATISIAMKAPVDSLNAGVAAAILLYEGARQRRHAASQARQ